VFTDDVKPGQFRLFAEVFGEIGHRKIFTGSYDDAAVTLVEPLRLCARRTRLRPTALHAPTEHLHGVGDFFFNFFGLLVHLVTRRSAAQMGQPCAGDQTMRGIFVVQRCQYAASVEQLTVIRAAVTTERIDLGDQGALVTDGGKGKFTSAAYITQDFDSRTVDYANLTQTLLVLKLNQPHDALLFLYMAPANAGI